MLHYFFIWFSFHLFKHFCKHRLCWSCRQKELFFFGRDVVLSEYSGMIVVTFCVMFSLPFMYYLIKSEEEQDEHIEGFFSVWRAHSDAVCAFIWLFLGFVVAFSFWNIGLGDS